MERTLRVLAESEAKPESFHDCHVHGLHWRRDQFIFSLDIQYILEWLEPSDASSGAYRFLVSEARLVFRDASEMKVSMDWSGSALDSEIASVRVLGSRTTPNGQVERCFEIEFADPDGTISVWSTGYEVILLQEPVVSEVPSIALSDGQ
jgi:hypothetical protein